MTSSFRNRPTDVISGSACGSSNPGRCQTFFFFCGQIFSESVDLKTWHITISHRSILVLQGWGGRRQTHNTILVSSSTITHRERGHMLFGALSRGRPSRIGPNHCKGHLFAPGPCARFCPCEQAADSRARLSLLLRVSSHNRTEREVTTTTRAQARISQRSCWRWEGCVRGRRTPVSWRPARGAWRGLLLRGSAGARRQVCGCNAVSSALSSPSFFS